MQSCMGPPCVLPWLGSRDPGIHQRDRPNRIRRIPEPVAEGRLRARADPGAPRAPRRSPASLSVDPRGRDERQVDGDSHVRGWRERIRMGGEEADFEAAIERVRAEAERLDATQFEVLTAAALTTFAEAGVDVAVVEAGLGGRHDATNVLRSPIQVLT